MRRQAEQPVASCSIDTLREKVYPCRALRGEPLKGERSESPPVAGIVRPLTAEGARSRTLTNHGRRLPPILKSKAVVKEVRRSFAPHDGVRAAR